ncbi:DUF3168 domain-containing protein [Streptomyces sp. NPDC032940]|uniref:DUF3168 domain-containing protein n=1 Tax=Streptomyces sp. NPDC032940 TaxID=3155366 RepID=UPI0033DA0088
MEEYERQLIAELVAEPETVRERLRPEDREKLDVLLGLLAEGGDEHRAMGITQLVADHLRRALPDEGHSAAGRRYAAADRPPHETLLAHFSLAGADAVPDQEAGTLRSARDRILEEPALTADDLRDVFGVDPAEPELIRLRPGEGPEVLPAFQFDGEGRPRPLVLTVNGLLGAAGDPWGVADWWLGPNLWLDAVPATLLGAGLDDQLLAAARAVGEDD